VTLVADGRGEFTVTADGKVLWDKHKEGRFPEHDEVLDPLEALTG
jgi:selT/selW/selH-like putative selenoprotein